MAPSSAQTTPPHLLPSGLELLGELGRRTRHGAAACTMFPPAALPHSLLMLEKIT